VLDVQYPTTIQFPASTASIQINVIPIALDFPVLMEQLKSYQQYRIISCSYLIVPFRNVNVGTDDLPHVYDVAIPAGQVPTPLSVAYLSYKNFQLDLLDRKFPWRTFVPYAATNSAI